MVHSNWLKIYIIDSKVEIHKTYMKTLMDNTIVIVLTISKSKNSKYNLLIWNMTMVLKC